MVWEHAIFAGMRDGFKSLEGSPKELWMTFIAKFFASFSYFALSIVFTLFLTDEFEISDYKAGYIYGMWGTLAVLYGLLLGGVVDYLGVRTCVVFSFAVEAVARVALAVTRSRNVMYLCVYLALPVSGALGTPVKSIAVRRYTTAANRGFAFGLFYAVMNIAALMTGAMLDTFRVGFKRGFEIEGVEDTPFFWVNNGVRLLLMLTAVTSAIGLGFATRLKDIKVMDPAADGGEAGGAGGQGAPLVPRSAPRSDIPGAPALVEFAPRKDGPWAGVLSVVWDREFWKFVCMSLFTINLKGVFRHLDATLPKYAIRRFGCDVPVGVLYSINPFMIIFLVPVVAALTTKFNHFDMIHYGGYVSALAPLWISVHESIPFAMLFVVQLSLGEAIWSPRWYDYTMSVAPEGREGTFAALALAPVFAAKLPTGMLSGYLLQRFCGGGASNCDEHGAAGPVVFGACDGRSLWGIIGLITLSSPVLIFLTQRWIRPVPAPGAAGGERDVELAAAGATMQVHANGVFEGPGDAGARTPAAAGGGGEARASGEAGVGGPAGELEDAPLIRRRPSPPPTAAGGGTK